MELHRRKALPWVYWAQVTLIIVYLTQLLVLFETDCYYTVHLLCGVMGIVSLTAMRFKDGFQVTLRQNIGLLVGAVLFSGACMLANYQYFLSLNPGQKFIEAVIWLFGGICVGYSILRYMFAYTPEKDKSVKSVRAGIVFLSVFVLIAIVDLTFLFFVRYPGVLTLDSMASVREFQNNWYSNLNPFYFTVTIELFYWLGYALFGNPNAAIAFYVCVQVLFMAACFAYCVVTLYQAGVPKWYWIAAFAAYWLQPYHIAYSVTVWKDVVFSGAALLIVTALYRILRGIGKRPWLSYVIFTVGILGLSLWRTNGWYAVLVMGILTALLLWKRNRKLVMLLGTLIVGGWILINPALDAWGVSSTDMVEAFSIPLQQIARVVYDGNPITEDEEALLEQMLDMDIVREDYTPDFADPIKWYAFRRDNLEFIREHFGEYAKLWLKMGMRYPTVYLKAWVDQTKGYWNGGYSYWIYADQVVENEFGIEPIRQPNAISDGFMQYFSLFESSYCYQPLISIGLHVWALFACLLVNVLHKRREALLCIPIVVLVVGLWLGTPVFAEFRYAYPVFVSMPLILGATLFAPKDVT